ncbi:TetR/AcrR family transcriptional regulator [Actinoplanes sp. TBRC 11911]|uniref:TetR/AcrR family transcriptional regulator n=1 Tax=Actinoplanes sp. TBRC 11911 TaxID=2729386 RepID=UPI00145C3ADD|nr:TetR/AcrR family transcriptional regulator [Actinoplanes sp. TBRC 11911]NMO51486.1 TetR/AcrR family transcriptional regulator [Actinoplanes sp. TBRC 11911]
MGRDGTLRKDAERNRERIIAAATKVFAEVGVHAPVDEIAKEAGVGVGTIYRRFPDRTELVEAVFVGRVERYLTIARECMRIPDAGEAFRTYVQRMCAMQAEDQLVTDVLTLNLPVYPRLPQLQMRLHAMQNRLIRGAKRAGRLRADFTPEDMALVLIANAAIVKALGRDLPQGSPRFVGLTLDGLGTDRPSELPPSVPAAPLVLAMQRPPVHRRPTRGRPL